MHLRVLYKVARPVYIKHVITHTNYYFLVMTILVHKVHCIQQYDIKSCFPEIKQEVPSLLLLSKSYYY